MMNIEPDFSYALFVGIIIIGIGIDHIIESNKVKRND